MTYHSESQRPSKAEMHAANKYVRILNTVGIYMELPYGTTVYVTITYSFYMRILQVLTL